MKTKYLLKKVVALIIVLIAGFALAACKGSTKKIPYGSLDETVYLSGDGYKITKKELYKEMRTNEISVLEKMIYRLILADEIETINENKANYKDDFVDIVNDKIFFEDDIDELKEMKDEDINKLVAKFVDLLYLEGVVINPTDVDTVNFTEHSQVILDFYIIDVAKKIHAQKLLDEEILDEKSDYYIDVKDALQNYYKNEVEKKYPLSSINIRFTNSYEANQTLRHFNLKSYRSKWYLVPNPRVDVVEGYARDVLVELDLEDKNGSLSESEHQEYYDKYVVNPTREPVEHADVSLTLDEVLVKFFEIYNFVYPYKAEVDTNLYSTVEDVLNAPELVNDDEENLGQFTKLYDDYPSAQSSLRTYIYDTLSTEEDGTRYTASPRNYGNYYFLSFKLKDHNEDIKAYVNEDDELIIYTDETEETLTDYAQEYYDEIAKSKLSSTYISTKFKDLLKEAKIVVYDEVLYLHLKREEVPATLSKKNSNTVVVKVDDKEILVDDLYEELEAKIGPNIAMDMAVRQILLNSDYMEKITDEMKKEYKDNVENVIREFSQNGYEQSGMPASMGRKNFLRLSFNSETIEEAVERVYIRNELERLFYMDYERFYGDVAYEKFAAVANRLRNQFFTISSSHLLIYVDMDEDDEPDNPEDFFETLTEVQIATYKEMVVELMQLIHDRASKHSSFAAGLRSVVSDFNDSTKFRTDLCDADENIEYRPECTWAKYKRYGFFLKFEDLGNINHTANYPDSDSGWDKDFFARLHHLHGEIKAEYYDVDKKFPTQLLDDKPLSYDGDEENLGVLETSFGWHLILVTGGDVAQSAKFTYEDDTYIDSEDEESLKIFEEIKVKDREGNEVILDAYSADDDISVNQARIFMYESTTDRGVVSLPNDVLSALNNYLTPIKTKYESNYTKMFLLYKLLKETNYTYANPQSTVKLDGVLDVNMRQFLEYNEDNELFLEIYADWFDLFG